MLASIPSATLLGVEGHPITVEVHIGSGLPAFTVVGLPDANCREARDRTRAAFSTTELQWPRQKVVVNLAPSALPLYTPAYAPSTTESGRPRPRPGRGGDC